MGPNERKSTMHGHSIPMMTGLAKITIAGPSKTVDEVLHSILYDTDMTIISTVGWSDYDGPGNDPVLAEVMVGIDVTPEKPNPFLS